MPEVRRVALVTGASRGIGRCAAVALARRGFDVVITARTVHEGDGRAHASSTLVHDDPMPIAGSLDTTAAEIEALGRTCLPVPMDLMDRASVERVPAVALAELGRVDVLVNNAIYQGPGTMDRILDLPLELAERCLVGDYLHPLLLTQLLLPGMLERGEGRLVNMLSEAAFTTPPAPAGAGGWGVAYAAAKAAFHRVTDMCHVEFAGQGIAAFSIAPGLTLTESMRASGMDEVLVGAGHVPGAARGGRRGGRLARRRPRRPALRRPDGVVTQAVQGAGARARLASAPLRQAGRTRQPHRIGERHQPRSGDLGGAGGQRTVELVERLIAERARRPARPTRRSAPRPCRAACDRRRWRARRRAAGRGSPASAVAPSHSSSLQPRLSRSNSTGIALVPGRQHVRVQATDAVDHQCRHVPVPAVLAQRRAGLPGLAEPAGPERRGDAGPERLVGRRP